MIEWNYFKAGALTIKSFQTMVTKKYFLGSKLNDLVTCKARGRSSNRDSYRTEETNCTGSFADGAP